MTKRIIIIIVSILLVGSLLSSCGIFSSQPQLDAPEIIKAENVLNLYNIDPITLDPAASYEMTSQDYILQLFSGLVRLGNNLEPVPDIAEKWEISNYGKTYTFYIRKGATFHNGREVTAHDFKYSWERACAPEIGSPTAITYLGDIVGAVEVISGLTREISGVRIIDDYTLEVTIDSPKSYFLSKLTYPTTFVVDKSNVESGVDWWHNPIGTGPFKLLQWNKNDTLIISRYENYYGKKAKLNRVVFLLYGGRPMNLYETGEIDVTYASVSYIDKITDTSGPLYQDLMSFPELSLSYIGFNHTKPPFDDVNIRRAFSLAVDKDKIIRLIYRDMVKRADGILPSGIPGYNSNLSVLEYDVDRAIELIKQSKYGDVANLPSITLTVSGRAGYLSQDLVAAIYQWEQNLGVEVKVRQLEPEQYFYRLEEEKDELFEMGWIADYPHPQDFLELLFRTDAKTNIGEYSNAEVDELLERAGIEQDNEQSLILYQQAEQILVDDAVCIPISFGQNYLLVKPYVKGYEPDALGITMLNEVYIETD